MSRRPDEGKTCPACYHLPESHFENGLVCGTCGRRYSEFMAQLMQRSAEPECTCLTNQLGPHYCEKHTP